MGRNTEEKMIVQARSNKVSTFFFFSFLDEGKHLSSIFKCNSVKFTQNFAIR